MIYTDKQISRTLISDKQREQIHKDMYRLISG